MQIAGDGELVEWSLLAARDCADQELLHAVAGVMQAENVLAGLRLRLLAEVDSRELAAAFGCASTVGWLTGSARLGAGAARRMLATAQALDGLPQTAHQLAVGELSEPHAGAIVTATALIDDACPELPASTRSGVEDILVDVALSGTPAAVARRGQELLLVLAPPQLDATAAEDVTRNRLELGRCRNGRTVLRGDFDVETAEKLHTALSPLSGPHPAEDGTPDPRGAAQRRADGFADILDAYLGNGCGPGEGGVRPHVTLTTSARELAERARVDLDDPAVLHEPWPFQLQWMGPISEAAARMLACDCDLTHVSLDGNEVPLNLGRTERLITPGLRRALIVRDQGCAFPACGRPAAWCQGHHVIHWADGGPTDLANIVLLCKYHHRYIHKGQWEVFIGEDGHPWFVPPALIDRHRRPLPAHGRAGAQAA